MIEFLQQYASEFIAGLAAILAAVANWRAVRAEKMVRTIQKAERRTDILVEIEQQNAAVGKLALVTAQKVMLLQQFPELLPFTDDEIKRLRSNLNVLSDLKNQEDEQRKVAEAAGSGSDVTLHHHALADVRRLRVRLEADLEKETAHYSQLLEASRGQNI
ncbi:hypothetical protein FE848_18520 [Marinobacter sp. 1-3A]|uniref:hypothetical protein n=1 Tax=Marinobacter sp. 1-3A TaxID=2582920 RepID=UPI001907B808|nr:hypothetical protein [Marinobacter sp. 1-3A]MBK1875210.1 hypothetical protein [Marinobacter sp. 1-3A]